MNLLIAIYQVALLGLVGFLIGDYIASYFTEQTPIVGYILFRLMDQWRINKLLEGERGRKAMSDILDYINERGEASFFTLCADLNLEPALVGAALHRLQKFELVEIKEDQE